MTQIHLYSDVRRHFQTLFPEAELHSGNNSAKEIFFSWMNYASGVLNYLEAVNRENYVMYFSCVTCVKVEFLKTGCPAFNGTLHYIWSRVKLYTESIHREAGKS